MARQKKIVKFVPNTKLPCDDKAMRRAMWEARNTYTLNDLVEMTCQFYDNTDAKTHYWGNEGTPREYFKKRLEQYDLTEDNWHTAYTTGTSYGAKSTLNTMLGRAYRMSKLFDETNNAFMEEYRNRDDLQTIYKKFYNDHHWLHDRWGVSKGYLSNYTPMNEREAIIKWRAQYEEVPETFLMFQEVCDGTEAARFMEINRDTPFEAGDLVRLRDPFVYHSEFDPLYASSYEVYNNMKPPTPDRETVRLATVMKVTSDTRRYYASKGSKLIEVMWFGQEGTVHVPEKVLKWMERPTKKNGMVK